MIKRVVTLQYDAEYTLVGICVDVMDEHGHIESAVVLSPQLVATERKWLWRARGLALEYGQGVLF